MPCPIGLPYFTSSLCWQTCASLCMPRPISLPFFTSLLLWQKPSTSQQRKRWERTTNGRAGSMVCVTHHYRYLPDIASIVSTNLSMNLMMSRGKYVGRCTKIENTCGDAWCATWIYATFASVRDCETLTDYSFLSRYHYTKSKNYLKRRYRIRHWIPMFIGTPCTITKAAEVCDIFRTLELTRVSNLNKQ